MQRAHCRRRLLDPRRSQGSNPSEHPPQWGLTASGRLLRLAMLSQAETHAATSRRRPHMSKTKQRPLAGHPQLHANSAKVVRPISDRTELSTTIDQASTDRGRKCGRSRLRIWHRWQSVVAWRHTCTHMRTNDFGDLAGSCSALARSPSTVGAPWGMHRRRRLPSRTPRSS